jgi:PAS domain S-box-containing protein
MDSGWLERRTLFAAALLYGVCLLAAWSTELLSSISGAGISIWLPTGFIFAFACITPYRHWPFWALAAVACEFTGNFLWYRHELGPLGLLMAGNLLAAFGGAYLFRQRKILPYSLTNLPNTTWFLTIGAVLMPLVSASVISTALGWSYGKPMLDAWPRIFLGDATGNIVAAPFALLLLGAAAPHPRLTGARQVELVLLVLLFAGFAALSLGGFLPRTFVMIPPLLWAAFRFRVAGAILASLALTIIVAILSAAALGLFAETANSSAGGRYILLLFLLVATSTALLVGSVVEENLRAFKQLRASNETLEQRVDERSALLAESEAKAQQTAQLLTAIGEACPDLIYAKDRDFNIIYANSAVLQLFDLPSFAELETKGEAAQFPLDNQFDIIRRNDAKVLKSGKTVIGEEPVTNRHGETRIYRSTKAPLYGAAGELVGLAGVSIDITDAKKAAEREQLLVREIQHRARNLLTVVQSIVQLTSAGSVRDFKGAISRRIQALARSNDALAASAWDGVSLSTIVAEEMAPYSCQTGTRVRCSGPDILLDAVTAQSIALVVHELATNAAKYGAFTTEDGHVSIEWTCTPGDEQGERLRIEWQERGGPSILPPKRHGFGSTVIKLLGEERPGDSVTFDWDPAGLTVILVRQIDRELAYRDAALHA